ncbi:MAG: GTP-binding protein [Candidatus Lokiarchaeota archaeon]|nr:GTP-binding protein [Candidatus Lokiarchaeota archaeon]
MDRQIISGIVYLEMNDELGPNPVAWLGTQFSQIDLIHISIKALTILSGEKGLVPESLVILPFPSKSLKGLVKYIKWDDPSRRGEIGQSAIVLLFQEIDDVIFYKYLKEVSIPFNNLSGTIISLEKSGASREDFINVLEHLEFNISSLLEELRLQEVAQQESASEEFPEQQIKDRSLIDYQFKIIIVGDPSVGKTSLILRYTDNAFRRNYVPTLGVMVTDKIFKIENSVVQLTLWDIGGQQKFQTMRQQFYRGSDAVFLVFDLTRLDSFNNIPKWFSDVVEQQKDSSQKLMGFIIGNKKDLTEQRQITSDMASQLASKLKLGFIETSALLGENVDYAFSTIANYLFQSRL